MEENTFEKIEAYLSGEMKEADRKGFEAQIQADPQLAEEVSLQRDTHSLLQLGTQLEYKSRLQALDKEMRTESKVKPLFSNARILTLAATIIIGVGVIVWSMFRSGESLYTSQFSAYPDITTVRDDTVTTFRTGMVAYTNGQYEIAEEYLLKHLEEVPGDDFAYLYLGNAYLGMQKPAEAIAELLKVKEERLVQPSQWYLALAYGANGQEEEARKLLEAIAAEEGHAYKDKAEALLR